MKPLSILLCLFPFSLKLSAQSDTLIRYFDAQYREVPPSKASDTAITIRAVQPDGSYLVQDFYASSGKIMRRSYYTDTSMKVKAGPYEVFHKNGRIKTKGRYHNGLRQSTWKSWDEKGELADSVSFNEKGNMTGVRITHVTGMSILDSVVFDPDGSGRGTSYGFFGNGKKSHVGKVVNDQLDGEWTFYHRSGRIASQENYVMDKLVNIRCFDENGKPKPGKCQVEVEADFPGGTAAWSAYLTDRLESNLKKLNRNGADGIAVVQFVIDTLGKVTDVSLHQKTNTPLDAYALKIIQESPDWIPARWHNVAVKAYRRQPIQFKRE